MTDLAKLVAATNDYAPPRTGYELDALLLLARPQFEALAKHLASLPDDELVAAGEVVRQAWSQASSPYSNTLKNGLDCQLGAKMTLLRCMTHHPTATQERCDLFIDAVSGLAHYRAAAPSPNRGPR